MIRVWRVETGLAIHRVLTHKRQGGCARLDAGKGGEMKARLAAITVAFLVGSQAFADDYTLTIDGKQHDVDLGKQAVISLPDGRKINVLLERKAVVSFRSENLTFQHSSKLTPARTEVSPGIFQTMMASPRGSVVLVQEYTSINPCGLIDLMLTELTKEEVQYGYALATSPTAQKLSTGQELNGKKVVSKYKDKETTRRVICFQARDAGIMIVTQIEKDASLEDFAMIETLWTSLQISMK